MANQQILALSQSPLFNSLMTDSSYKDLVYSLNQSVGPISKHRVELPLQQWISKTTQVLDIPRYGLIHNMYLRLSFKNESGGSITPNIAYFSRIFDRISLMTHSIQIEQLTPMTLLCYVHNLYNGDSASGIYKLVDYQTKFKMEDILLYIYHYH